MKIPAASSARQPIAGILTAFALGASCLLPAKAEVFVNYNYTTNWNSTGFFDPVEGPARRAVLESVVNYMLSQFTNLQDGRTLNLSIAPDSTPGQLAGASVQFAGSANSFVDTSFYRNLVLGINTGGSGSDLNLFVNFTSPNWYVGTGVPGSTQVDLFTVLLHEMTHGLGFSAKINSTGSSSIGNNKYPVFSSYLQRGDGSPLLELVGGVLSFAGTTTAMTSDDIYFAGPMAVLANGGNRVRMFAPSSFSSGSSLQHISNSSSNLLYPGELRHVMRPQLANGHYQREWTTIERAILKDIGWELTGTPGNTYADWISGYPGVGELTGFNDDADKDGIDNGLENYFGTDPDDFSAGLVATGHAGNTFTFTHPLGDTPASDITAAYRWSKDLASFQADGATFQGTTVTFSQSAPAGGMVEVTATTSGTPLDRLFVVIEATRN